jgi:diguanylate cyclase (GGDEF)-like protein
VARLGGDEFAAVLPHLTVEDAEQVAADLEQALAERPVRVEGFPMTARVSIGVAVVDPALGAERSLREADRAMYAVKGARGR